MDPKGQRVEFGYDELRRLTSARFLTQAGTTERHQQLGYDPEGSLVSIGEQVAGATRNYTRSYDGRRRLERATDCFGNTVRYGYDNANRVTSLRTEGATAGVNEVRYDYDDQDRISRVKDATNAVLASYQYRPDNQLSSVAYANGMTRAYSYDSANRVTAIENAWAGGGERFEYEYDVASNRKNEKRYLNGQNTRDVNYTYDLWDRLTGARYEDRLGGGVAALSYGYDLVGNRTSETGTRPGGEAVNRTFSYDDLNQITSMVDGVDPRKSATFQHDANGNLISETEAGGRVKQFAYDVRDQMTAAWETPAGGSQSLLGSYEYDYQKRRVRKTVGGQALDYIYNGINVVGEAAGGQLVARYDFGADLVRAAFAGESGSRWYGHDALGSTTALVGDDGALAARYEYGAWGELISAQQPALNRVGFTGYRLDDETGLNYAINRYYDSETGRFTTADPLTELDRGNRLRNPQGLNLYPYVMGNPLKYLDPDGLDWWVQHNLDGTYRLHWVAHGIEAAAQEEREGTLGVYFHTPNVEEALRAGWIPLSAGDELKPINGVGSEGSYISDYAGHPLFVANPSSRNFREAFWKKDVWDATQSDEVAGESAGQAEPKSLIEWRTTEIGDDESRRPVGRSYGMTSISIQAPWGNIPAWQTSTGRIYDGQGYYLGVETGKNDRVEVEGLGPVDYLVPGKLATVGAATIGTVGARQLLRKGSKELAEDAAETGAKYIVKTLTLKGPSSKLNLFKARPILARPYAAEALAQIPEALRHIGALRELAQQVHQLKGRHRITLNQSAVAIAQVRLRDGTRQIWGAGSSGILNGRQQSLMQKAGVTIKGGSAHAEMNIIRSLPEGAIIERWGISWTSKFQNIPCGTLRRTKSGNACRPFVDTFGAILE